MPRRPSATLTAAELRMMEAIWERPSVTVNDVLEALPAGHGLAYNTVLTMLRILETKGYLRHSKPKTGRAFSYRPLVSRAEARRRDVTHLLRRFFGNSRRELILSLLEEESLSAKEWRRIRELIEEKS